MKKDLKTLNRSLALAIAAAMTMTSAPAAAYAADVDLADVDVTADEEAAVEVEESTPETENAEVQAEENEDVAAVTADEKTADAEDLFSDDVEVSDDTAAEVGVPGTPAKVTGLMIVNENADGKKISPELRWNADSNTYKYEFSVTDADGVEYAEYMKDEKTLEYSYTHTGSELPSYVVSNLEGMTGYKLGADGTYEHVYADAAKTKLLTSMTVAGKTYSIRVRAVYYFEGKETAGEWSDPVSYTTTTTKTPIQISNLRLSSEDEDNYYFAFDGNLTAGYVEAQISTDKDFNDIRSYRYLWSNDDEKTICVPKSDLESEKTYYIRAYNYVDNDYIKDADGNPVYSNTATFTCTAPKADELKVITGLTNYKTNINGFYFRFDPTLDTEKDDYELQYAKDANFENIVGSKANSSIIYASEIETDVNYYVRAITYRVENGEKKYAKSASNTVTITKAKYPSITKLAVTEKDSSGYTFKYEGSLNSYRSGAEVWLSTDPSFKNDGSSTRTFYIGGGYYDDEDDYVTSDNTFTIATSQMNPGKTYYVKARAYSKDSALLDDTKADEAWYGSFTNTVSVKPFVSKVSVTAAVTGKTITLKAEPVNGNTYVTGYQFQKKSGKKYKNLTKNTDGVYTDKKLKQNATYTYRVRAYYVNEKTGATTYGSWKTYTTVTWGGNLNLKAAAKSKNSVKLTWNKIKGASGYEVYRAVTESARTQESADAGSNAYTKWQLVKTIKKSSTKSYTVKKLAAGTNYSFKVRAYKVVKNKKYYIDGYAYVSLDFDLGNVREKQLTNGTVKLTWSPVYAGNGYLIEKKNNDTDRWETYRTITKASTSAVILPKADGQSVSYRLRAYKNGNPKEYTDAYEITVNPYLAVPTSVKTSVNKADGSVTVSWKGVAGADFYRVYRSKSPAYLYDKDTRSYSYSNGEQLTEWITDSNSKYAYKASEKKLTATSVVDRKVSYVDNSGVEHTWHDGPQAGVKYYYYVVACKNGTTYNWKPSDNKYDDDEYDVITSGCSAAATASVSNTTIGKTKITSGKSSKGKVNLKWQKVNGAAGYVVYRSTKKGSGYTKIAEITKGSTVKYTDKTAKKGKKYYYKVRAVKANEAGVDVFSAYSAAKAVKVK